MVFNHLLILTSSKSIFKSVPTKCSGMSVHKHPNLCIYMYLFNKCRQASKPAYLHASVFIQVELSQEMPQNKLLTVNIYFFSRLLNFLSNYLKLIVFQRSISCGSAVVKNCCMPVANIIVCIEFKGKKINSSLLREFFPLVSSRTKISDNIFSWIDKHEL